MATLPEAHPSASDPVRISDPIERAAARLDAGMRILSGIVSIGVLIVAVDQFFGSKGSAVARLAYARLRRRMEIDRATTLAVGRVIFDAWEIVDQAKEANR